jgi:hypothetical protein
VSGARFCLRKNPEDLHRATAPTGITHIAIQEALDGKVTEWMEQVSEEQYRQA